MARRLGAIEPEVTVPPGHVAVRLLRAERSGQVIAARRSVDDALVVLRVLPASVVADAAGLARLRRDIAKLAGRPHQAVVEPFSFLDPTGCVAVESEFTDAVRLDDILISASLSTEAALVLLYDILDGLSWIHHLGVVHMDVRPGTVAVDTRGRARICDSGVATPVFKPSLAPGTPAYMAPEIWNEDPPTMSTDIYATAATMFEAITGAPPFARGRVQAVRAAHLRAPVPAEKLPQPIRVLVATGLAKDPTGRPPSAAAYRDEVRRAAPVIAGEHWEQRGRAHLAGMALCAATLLPSVVISGMADSLSPDQAPRVVEAEPAEPGARSRLRLVVGLAAAALLVLMVAWAWNHSNGGAHRNPVNTQPTPSTSGKPATGKPAATPPVAVPVTQAPKPARTPSPRPTTTRKVTVTFKPTPAPTLPPLPTP